MIEKPSEIHRKQVLEFDDANFASQNRTTFFERVNMDLLGLPIIESMKWIKWEE